LFVLVSRTPELKVSSVISTERTYHKLLQNDQISARTVSGPSLRKSILLTLLATIMKVSVHTFLACGAG
jgi:hypothetical protein